MTSRSLFLHGPAVGLNGFALANRRLSAALGPLGWQVHVAATDDGASLAVDLPPPDVYLFHGHPYDRHHAPGRVNAYLLSYDYARFIPADRGLAEHLNRRFDLVVVPARAALAACRRSGVTIPIVVSAYGVDHQEFGPRATPVDIPGRRRFCFLALGGTTERKGTDLLLEAYAREFTDADDVTLVVKACAYPHLESWADALIARARGRRRAPHIVYDRSEAASVAGYYTAADMGIFPFRAEGFGLPVLECLASGRPAIVTRAGGPLDFATTGVTWLRAPQSRRHGKPQAAPDVRSLRRLMRAAVEHGPMAVPARQRIADSVRAYTWAACATRLSRALTQARPRRRAVAPPRRRSSTVYVYLTYGVTSWKHQSTRVARALSRRDPRHRNVPFATLAQMPPASLTVAQSDYALEAFLRAPAGAPRLLHRESAPLAVGLAIVQRERQACGLPPLPPRPLALWRDAQEAQRADVIVVPSQVALAAYVAGGRDPRTMRAIWPGIVQARVARRAAPRRPRVLFVGTSPFRKGLRPLLSAWSRLNPRAAELWCLCPNDILLSPVVLRHLTRARSISVHPLRSYRGFLPLYADVDVVVLPSFEDGFGLVAADAMARGLPVIVSSASGVSELVRHGESGLIVDADRVDTLASALDLTLGSAGLRARLGDQGREATRPVTWREFECRWQAVVDGMLA